MIAVSNDLRIVATEAPEHGPKMNIHKLYRIFEQGGEEHYAILGYYSSEPQARLAKLRATKFWEGDKENSRFEISAGELDRVQWTSGFGEE